MAIVFRIRFGGGGLCNKLQKQFFPAENDVILVTRNSGIYTTILGEVLQ